MGRGHSAPTTAEARSAVDAPQQTPTPAVAIAADDVVALQPGAERRATFLTELRSALERMVDDELRGTGLEGRGCPLIEQYVRHYETQSVEVVQSAALRYSRLAPPVTSATALRDAIVARARDELRRWRASGELPRLPFGLTPPPVLSAERVLRELFGGSLLRKGVGTAAGEASPPALALARLGRGTPLPLSTRAQLEPALGASLSGVRIHDDARGAALAAHERAHAVAIGSNIAFAAGAYRADTLFGRALLAHEAAHAIQQGREGADAPTALEHDADRSAIAFVAGMPVAPQGRAGGLSLQRCQDSTPMPEAGTFDWRAAAESTTAEAVPRIRALQEELERLAAAPLTPENQQRIEQLQEELNTEVDRLRAAGIRLDMVRLMQAISHGDELLRVSGHIDGLEETTVAFGERRALHLALDWMPQHTDVRVAWIAQTDIPNVVQAMPRGDPGTSFDKTLNDTFWSSYERSAFLGLDRGGAPLPRVRVLAQVFVGSGHDPEVIIPSEWLDVREDAPDLTTIESPRILTLEPERAASTDPEELTRPPAVTASAPVVGRDLILEDTTIPFVLSWVPPLGLSTGHGFRLAWATSPANSTLSRRELEALPNHGSSVVPDRQHTVYTHEFSDPGEFVVYAVLQPGTVTRGAGFSAGSADELLVAARRIRVVDAETLATAHLGLHGGEHERREFDTFMDDLGGELTSAREALEGGSPTPDALRERIRRLTEQQHAIESSFGRAGAMLPFPEADSGFRRDQTYVTPIATAYAHPDIGGAQPLTTYVKMRWTGTAWEATLVDATTSEILPRTGTAGDPYGALRGALRDWESRNDFPTHGQVVYRFERYGWNIHGHFDTTSTAKTVREWASTILSVVGLIAGVILLLLPEPTGATKGLGVMLIEGTAMAAMVGGLLLGAYELYRNYHLGRPILSERNALEALNIIATLVGLRGTRLLGTAGRTVRAGAATTRTLSQIRLGTRLVVTSSVLDVGTFLYASGSALAQLQRVAHDESVPDSEREAMLLRTIAMLAVQGLLVIGSNRDLFGRMVRGRVTPGLIDARIAAGERVELDPYNRAVMQLELRNLGLAPSELRGLDDVSLVRLLGAVHQAHAANPASGALGSAYGYGLYPLQDAALSLSQFKSALRGGIEMPAHTTYSFSGGTNTATLTVDVGGGAQHTVNVVFLRYPRQGTTVPASPHDRPGRARFALVPATDANGHVIPGEYSATVYLHERLSRDDTRLLANGELREISEIVHGYPRSGAADFETHRAAQEVPGLFHVTTSVTNPAAATAQDRAMAHELRRLWESAGFDAMAVEAIPPGPARDRIDRVLREMGFGRTATHSQLVDALAAVLGGTPSPKLLEFARQYRWRRSAEARLAYYGLHGFEGIRTDPALGAPTDSLIDQALIEHLMVPQGRTTSGIAGGHLDESLADFDATHPDYGFPVVGTGTTAEGIAYTRHEQVYRGTVVMVGGRPQLKTTVSDLQGFLTLAERTVLHNRANWSAWPAGHQSFGAGMAHGPLRSPAGTPLGGALFITKDASGAVTSVRLVAVWID